MGRLQHFFRDHNETRENHEIALLKTRYYKTKKDALMNQVIETLNASNKFHVLNVSTERGEISANLKESKKGLVVFTVVSVRPFRTAIDISVSFDTMLGIDFGKSGKIIQSFYKEMDKHFEYVGSGLADKL